MSEGRSPADPRPAQNPAQGSPAAGELPVDSTDNRFSRTELLIGKDAAERLRGARVAIFGLGAVGSYALEALARAGVGFFRLVDFDVIRVSNFNRQLLALTPTIDKLKVDAASERLLQINPGCRVETRAVFVDEEAAPDLLRGELDVAIDAIDSLSPKVALIKTAVAGGVKLVSCMGAALRLDPFAVRAADIAQTRHCALARLIRKRLRKLGINSGVRCVYSRELPAVSRGDAPRESEYFARGRDRTPLGSISYMTGIFGLVAAHEALRLVLGRASEIAAADHESDVF